MVGLSYWTQYPKNPSYGTPFLDADSNLSISGAVGQFSRFGISDQYIIFTKIINHGEPLTYNKTLAIIDSDDPNEGTRILVNGLFYKKVISTGETIEDQFEISDAKNLITNSSNGKMLINIELENGEKTLGSFYAVLPAIYENNGNQAELKTGEEKPLQFVDEKTAMKEVYGPSATKIKNYYINMDKYNESIKAFDKAIEMDPKNETAWKGKGNALSTMGKYDEAIQAYDKAIGIDPQFADAWFGKGNALSTMGRYEEAIQAYDKAIEINPKDLNFWFKKGSFLEKLGRHEEANACYKKASELSG